MQLIDTHCHLTFDDLAGDIDAVIERSIASGVTSWITVGTDKDHNQKGIALAERFDNMAATVGIHPHYADKVTADDIAQLKDLAQNDKVVAVGETGLDFHYEPEKKPYQQKLFEDHLNIASDLNLPVVIHCREAFDDTMDMLKQFGRPGLKAIFHCFSGSAEQAKIVLDSGYYISFTGVVTFKNARIKRQAAQIVPLDRLMLETDCPYMSPEPVRKHKVNEPAFLVHIARFLADLKQMDFNDFASAMTSTTKSFFNLHV
jgi:TatD DNase family protein